MARGRLRVDQIGKGIFSTERSVSFEIGDYSYNLIVDEEDVRDSDRTLAVDVLGERGDRYLIDLPRETFTSGSRIFVPKSRVELTERQLEPA